MKRDAGRRLFSVAHPQMALVAVAVIAIVVAVIFTERHRAVAGAGPVARVRVAEVAGDRGQGQVQDVVPTGGSEDAENLVVAAREGDDPEQEQDTKDHGGGLHVGARCIPSGRGANGQETKDDAEDVVSSVGGEEAQEARCSRERLPNQPQNTKRGQENTEP